MRIQTQTAVRPKRVGSQLAPVLPSVAIARITIQAATEQEAIDFMLGELASGRGGWVITPNLDHLRRAHRDADFAGFLTQAHLVVADGMPLIWAARLQGTPLPGRVSGSSLIWTLSAAAEEEGRSVFLLGGDPGTAELAGRVLKQRSPRLRIAGTACPPVGFEKDPSQIKDLREQLAVAGPDIVYVALGSPKQERVIAMLRDTLPDAWWLGVGISFSFVCGKVTRAPVWMQQCGLEWVHRLIQEPRRLAKRYLIDDLPFAFVLLGGALLTRVRQSHVRSTSL